MKILEYKEFKDIMIAYVEEKYPEQIIALRNAVSINRVKDTLILEKENGLSPSLCFQDMYTEYLESGRLENAYAWIDYAVTMDEPGFDKNIIHTWEEDKHKIIPVLINGEKNKEIMEGTDIIYHEKLDLLVIYCMKVTSNEDILATVKVTTHFLQKWGIDEFELATTCFNNDNYELEDMGMFYILSNDNGHYGAAGIFFSNKLEQYANEVNDDLYLLPSSLHEVIILKKQDAEFTAAKMKEIVKEINQEVLNDEDYLSDTVYLYERSNKEISIVV